MKFSDKEQKMAGSLGSMCTKETYNYSTQANTKEKWIASMRGSLAKICQRLEKEPAWVMGQEADYIGKFSASLGRLDPSTSSLKTSQQSFIQDLNESWGTWPRWGLMQGGVVYEHPMSALPTPGIGGGSWLPTPLKSDHMKLKFKLKSVLKSTFGTHVNSIPYYMAARHGVIPSLDVLTWVMGFPLGWVDQSPLETRKYPCKQPQPTDCLEVCE